MNVKYCCGRRPRAKPGLVSSVTQLYRIEAHITLGFERASMIIIFSLSEHAIIL